MKVLFQELTEGAIPTRAHKDDAGFDLVYLGENFSMKNGQIKLIKCGFKMAIEEGYEAQIRPRSGLALKQGITVTNSPGTIDAGYRGEVGVILQKCNIDFDDNNTQNKVRTTTIKKGDAIAQMVFAKLPSVEVETVKELPQSVRGEGGFGSTSKSKDIDTIMNIAEDDIVIEEPKKKKKRKK